MAPFQTRTVALLLAGIILMATPSFAQRGDRRNGGENGRRAAVARAQPREGGESRGRVQSQQRVEPRQRVQSQQRIEPRQRVESQQRVEPRGRVESQQRIEPRQRLESQRRAVPRGRVESYRGNDNGRYNNGVYNNGRYVTRSYRSRTYVVPYGYRPYGYRPGWSVNLYFGRPYGVYGYPSAGYGYYAIAPGLAYGAVRIVDAPYDAQVFVDGYYAGVVDDYDGVFQHLNLEAGAHNIEIEAAGYPPIAFDVRVVPGQTITYRANLS